MLVALSDAEAEIARIAFTQARAVFEAKAAASDANEHTRTANKKYADAMPVLWRRFYVELLPTPDK